MTMDTYSEEDGVKYDGHIHEPILAAGKKRARRRELTRLRARSKARGMTDEELDRAMGKEDTYG